MEIITYGMTIKARGVLKRVDRFIELMEKNQIKKPDRITLFAEDYEILNKHMKAQLQKANRLSEIDNFIMTRKRIRIAKAGPRAK